ncbi:hypothetical protein MKX03_027367 [Papaver bracteatum]|nr:hypothetical protein MKX03_027367 [Papaver bracteatum]
MEFRNLEVSSDGTRDSEILDSDDDDHLTMSSFIPKLQIRKPKSKARWDSEMRMAEVLEQKGRCWLTTGISRGYIVGRHGVPWTLKNGNHFPTCVGDSKYSNGISVNELEEGFGTTDGFRNKQMNNAAKPVFDLFLPNNKFKKSSPGVPDSIVYLTTSPPPPSKEEIEDLEIRCKGVAVKVCNVEKLGRVRIFAYEKTEFPLG